MPDLVDLAFALKVIGPSKPESFGFQPNDTASRDDLVNAAIKAASDAVRTYCGRSFAVENRTLKLDNLDSDAHALRTGFNRVTAVPLVKEGGVALVEGSDFSWRDNGLLLRHGSDGSPKPWRRGIGAVEVTLTEGHAAVPEDVKWATARVVELLLMDKVAMRQGPYLRVGEFEVELPRFFFIAPELRSVLDRHKRRAMGAL